MSKARLPLFRFKISSELIHKINTDGKIFIAEEVHLTKFNKDCIEYWDKHIDFATPQDREKLSDVEYSLDYQGDDVDHNKLLFAYFFMWCIRDSDIQTPYIFYDDQENGNWGYSTFPYNLFPRIKSEGFTSSELIVAWTYKENDFETLKLIIDNYYNIIVAQKGHYFRLVNAIKFLYTAFKNSFPEISFIFYAIASESLFSFSSQEIAHQISENIAWFLEKNDSTARIEIYDKFKKAYKLRSQIMHGSKPKDLDVELINWVRACLRNCIVNIVSAPNRIQIYKSDDVARSYFKNMVLSGQNGKY